MIQSLVRAAPWGDTNLVLNDLPVTGSQLFWVRVKPLGLCSRIQDVVEGQITTDVVKCPPPGVWPKPFPVGTFRYNVFGRVWVLPNVGLKPYVHLFGTGNLFTGSSRGKGLTFPRNPFRDQFNWLQRSQTSELSSVSVKTYLTVRLAGFNPVWHVFLGLTQSDFRGEELSSTPQVPLSGPSVSGRRA